MEEYSIGSNEEEYRQEDANCGRKMKGPPKDRDADAIGEGGVYITGKWVGTKL
jgi:hypothetical protein